MKWIFLGLLAASVLYVVVREIRLRLGERTGERERLAAPGRAPENPIVGLGWNEQKDRIESLRCECGSRLRHIGGGPRSREGRELWTLMGECPECGETVTLYFADGPEDAEPR
ncbi:MAG: hypothetical protein HY720_07310 [Planctomycetes bacterium]|nr:hypothetical protein [Planctomycetota bacterium]